MEYVEVVGMFTHYSTADEIDKSYTNMQTSLFEKAVNTAKELGIHIPYIHSSNSAGSMELSNTFQNMVRVGIGIYGMYPSKRGRSFSCFSAACVVVKIKSSSY